MKHKRIDEVALINNCSLSSKMKFEFINYLDTGNITNGKIDEIQLLKNTEYPSRAKRVIKHNDIIFSTVRPNQCHYGIIKNVMPNMIVSTGFTVLSVTEEIDADYLYYYLTLPDIIQKLQNVAETSTSTYPSIKPSDIGNLQIPLPAINVQRKIGYMLSNISAKIELNNQINNNLQSLSQLLFKQWFVDFEFPNEEGLPYKSYGGEMVYSELGMIPTGWEVDKLDNVIEVIIDHRGKTPKKLGGDWSKSGIIALSAKIVKNHQLINIDSANRVDYDMYNRWMSVKLKYEDILMTSEAPLGEFYYMGKKCDYCLSQRVFAIRANRNIVQPTYLYRELSGDRGLNQIIARSTGSTVVGIKQSELRVIKIIIPNKKLQLKFHELACEIQNKIQNNTDESYFLNKLKDTLLPKLMNGEIDLDTLEINL